MERKLLSRGNSTFIIQGIDNKHRSEPTIMIYQVGIFQSWGSPKN